MLSSLDDYPVHQTSRPINEPISGDVNHYDRFFYNGYDAEGDVFFAIAFGVYPNKGIVDAALSVVRGGVQRNVYASGRGPLDRSITEIGPIKITIEEPMRRHRIVVDDNTTGLSADLVFGARTPAVQEPRFERISNGRTVMDYTRLTQWGSWSGTIRCAGEDITISPDRHRGCRDRSWGVRGGTAQGQAPSTTTPQFFWLWAPLSFDDVCLHLDAQEDADGGRWHGFGAIVPTLGSPSDPVVGPDVHIDSTEQVGHDITWRSGSRNADAAKLDLVWPDGTEHVELTPILTFFMNGVGYFHPTRAHGNWIDELSVHGDEWRTDEVDRSQFHRFHIQELCTARFGDRVGTGVLEQLVIGAHHPSGFHGLTDVTP